MTGVMMVSMMNGPLMESLNITLSNTLSNTTLSIHEQILLEGTLVKEELNSFTKTITKLQASGWRVIIIPPRDNSDRNA